MRTLGNYMAWLLKCIEAGRNVGIEKPVDEEIIKTNFIRSCETYGSATDDGLTTVVVYVRK